MFGIDLSELKKEKKKLIQEFFKIITKKHVQANNDQWSYRKCNRFAV